LASYTLFESAKQSAIHEELRGPSTGNYSTGSQNWALSLMALSILIIATGFICCLSAVLVWHCVHVAITFLNAEVSPSRRSYTHGENDSDTSLKLGPYHTKFVSEFAHTTATS
jgi:hypothetical protein